MKDPVNNLSIIASIVTIISVIVPALGFIYRRYYLKVDTFLQKKKMPIIPKSYTKYLGRSYMKEFKEPALRESDFYEEAGFRTNDENILRFNALKRFLGYTKWASLREAQDRISFKNNRVGVKWNFLDTIMMWLAGSMSIGLLGCIIWLILTFVPLLLNKEAVENAKAADLWFILFAFVVAIGYFYFFLYMLIKPIAVYDIKRGVDKFGDKIHYAIYKGVYKEDLTEGGNDNEIQINMISQKGESKRSFTPDDLMGFLNQLQKILKENDKLISEKKNKKEQKKGKSKKKK
ncbi:hypothetical protein [Myroides odoratimimus]|uniref:hypothetical protein n=1 Tax=Myroides odoratimimus TaxID=76832 RepID=UPI001CE0E800|nr:hypothetical protein [Myroides odoratimimus]MCA4792684.1 hypothetical protein [Myroides odoratimimus]MCA4819874.1 hypothetical protein [Myroides odoratimimus]MDM1401245.1 hypothetical protein [Myroides odoratimimus]MDM1457205.1 hypothetical protein [Myroides odoratimimus]MEC4085776.1 hypothetical protein [Myroides odoratimimus]